MFKIKVCYNSIVLTVTIALREIYDSVGLDDSASRHVTRRRRHSSALIPISDEAVVVIHPRRCCSGHLSAAGFVDLHVRRRAST